MGKLEVADILKLPPTAVWDTVRASTLFFLFPFESAVFQGIFDGLKEIQNSLLLPPLLQDGLHSLEGAGE